MNDIQKHVLMTGTSGFLGRNLLERLMETSPDRFHLLLRNSPRAAGFRKTLRQRYDPDRIVFVDGDITKPNCDVDTRQAMILSKTIDEIWHVAASTDFEEERREEIERMNTGGTRNLIGLAGGFDRLRDFIYTSTAYVAGKTPPDQRIPEGDLTPPGFKNPYEETKLGCEKMLRKSGLPLTILRPSILIGHSKTFDPMGETRMIDGYVFGFYLGLVRHFNRQKLDYWQYHAQTNCRNRIDLGDTRVNARPETTLNTVTIDDTVQVFDAIRQSDHRGKTYNVVNPQPVRMDWLMESIRHCLKFQGMRCVPNLEPEMLDRENHAEERMYTHQGKYFPYFHVPEQPWDRENVSALVADDQRVIMTEQIFHGLMSRFFDNIKEKKQQRRHAYSNA